MILYVSSIASLARAVLCPLLRVEPTSKPTCHCTDEDLDRLRDLVRQGIPQLRASHMIWAAHLIDTHETPAYGASTESWTTWARLEARRLANGVRTRLGLPLEPATVEAVQR